MQVKYHTGIDQRHGGKEPWTLRKWQPGQGRLDHILGVGSLELAVSAAFLALRLDAVN